MLKSILLSLYEFLQIILFYLAKIISIFIRHKKYLKFLDLRSPKHFYTNINISLENYTKISQEKNKSNSSDPKKIMWFHVSSAGEMEQAIPVARKLNEKMGTVFFVTYYSMSAIPFLKNFPALIGSSGLPLDARFVYKKLLHTLPITNLFFVRYDIWPSLVEVCNQNNVKMSLLSATKIKTKKGLRGYISKKFNNLFYKYFSSIFCVNSYDLKFFQRLNLKANLFIAGYAKWARAKEIKNTLIKTHSDKKFISFLEYCNQIKLQFNKKIIVIGSPHIQEHELILKMSTLKDKYFFIYAPHHIETEIIKQLELNLKKMNYCCIKYSEVDTFSFSNKTANENICILDNIGFLSEVYQIAELVLVGGGFDGQIHNVLEPAVYGVPVIFGPLFNRAQEARALIEAEAALSFESTKQMFHFLSSWVNFETETPSETSLDAKLKLVSQNALQLFLNHPDTSEVIFNAIQQKN